MTTESVPAHAVEAKSLEISQTVARLRTTFAAGRTRNVGWRKG